MARGSDALRRWCFTDVFKVSGARFLKAFYDFVEQEFLL